MFPREQCSAAPSSICHRTQAPQRNFYVRSVFDLLFSVFLRWHWTLWSCGLIRGGTAAAAPHHVGCVKWPTRCGGGRSAGVSTQSLGNPYGTMSWKQEAGGEVCQQSSEVTSLARQGRNCSCAKPQTLGGGLTFLARSAQTDVNRGCNVRMRTITSALVTFGKTRLSGTHRWCPYITRRACYGRCCGDVTQLWNAERFYRPGCNGEVDIRTGV